MAGFGKKLFGVFVEQKTEQADTDEADAPVLEDAVGADASVTTMPGMPAAPATPPTNIMSMEFPVLFSHMRVSSNPHADPLLTTFAGMAALDANARRTAMSAMITGMGVDVGSVAETLTKRRGALAAVVQHQNAALHGRQQARTKDCADQRASDEATIADRKAQIERLQQEISQLEAGVKSREAAAGQANAQDTASLDAFRARVQTEDQRLASFLAFIQSLSGGAK